MEPRSNVQLLLERGYVDVDRRDGSGPTALLNAAIYGKVKIVKLLLKRKDVDVNSKGNGWLTVR